MHFTFVQVIACQFAKYQKLAKTLSKIPTGGRFPLFVAYEESTGDEIIEKKHGI